MKNKISIIFILYFLFQIDLSAENLKIESKKITINKNNQTSIFEDEVLIITSDKNPLNLDLPTQPITSEIKPDVIKAKKKVK